jgi:hypothetical protein
MGGTVPGHHERVRRLLVVGIVLTVVTLAASVPAGKVPGCATGTIVQLELARTEERAVELIGGCDEAGLDELRTALRFDDLVFVPLYVITVGFWSVVGTRRLEWSSRRRRALVAAAAPAILVAGLLDLVENHHLATVVDAAGASPAIADAFTASVAKWLLAAYGATVAVVVLVRSVRAVRRGAGEPDVSPAAR